MRLIALGLFLANGLADDDDVLPGTQPLIESQDLSVKMMEGLHRCAERKIAESVAARQKFWNRDQSIEPNRKRFIKQIGAVDPRLPANMERFGDMVAETDRYRVWDVRWPVLDGVTGEGLLLVPKAAPIGHVVALPDADQTVSQFAGRLAENGFQVIVPTLISRASDFSGNPRVAMTNQPHREWIYRQAYHMGRHVIGYEVQKVMAAVDWFKTQTGKVGVAGYGEGGLLAFYAAAVDTRIDAALVSGYFDSRQRVWAEPIYRNVWGLLREFGDAEIASLIAPRGLVIDNSAGPAVGDPAPAPKGRRGGAAVGKLTPPAPVSVAAEFERIATLVPVKFQHRVDGPDAVRKFASLLGGDAELSRDMWVDRRPPGDRQKRQVKELEEHVQRLLRNADRARNEFFLSTTTLAKELGDRGQWFRKARVETRSPEAFAKDVEKFRRYFWEEVMGKLDDPPLAPNPRTRKIYDRDKWTGYDVVLDVIPDVFAWGVLLVPKDLKPGEKRPVVVCQHGRNGLPKDTIEGDTWAYHDFAARLAERGFITFAPHNLYRGEDLYRILNRKANAVKTSMFSYIIAQHQQTLNWLGSLPFVDAKRIAFYGLSYGGEAAVRVPPILQDYCLSICSGDFNDWARKVASTESDYSFMFTVEWEMPYFDMGSTFNYFEAASLMAPRPFMVERGHHDGVAPDEWVSAEYAKVRWLYAQLGLSDKTEIEFYNGGHTINGQGTFEFLHKHLGWPKR